ncbi:MAG: TIM barrel protein [Clostridia bacterium]|nr:TIM barrel protein [Clostridia bacterium]
MIKFGPSGNSVAFSAAGKSKSEESAVWVKEMGLSCFEYSFGRGVSLSNERALSIGAAFKDAGVEISVHAPYYINFANPDQEMVEKSYMYVLQSAEKVKLMGGKRVVFHPASQGKMKREQAVDLTYERLNILRDKIYENGFDDLIFCSETMGKIGQIGTVEEITRFCSIDKIYVPAVDFGHINARECGSLKTEQDYLDRLQYMVDNLGYEKMKNFHIHFSKIEYSAKGEVRHLTFEDDHYGPEFAPLSLALKKLSLEPYVICESAGTQDIDALKMQNIYRGN